MKISVRPARREDAPVIARAVAMAIGDEETMYDYCGKDYLEVLTDIVLTKDTQYHWHQALIAEADGIVAGAIVGYDGAQLEKLRKGTFAIIRKHIGRVPSISNETEAGEFYLDSLCVFPDFRRHGIGRKLIEAFCERAFSEGHSCVGLIVDYDNPRAEALYTSIGFKRIGTRIFFGHPMWHLQRKRKL